MRKPQFYHQSTSTIASALCNSSAYFYIYGYIHISKILLKKKKKFLERTESLERDWLMGSSEMAMGSRAWGLLLARLVVSVLPVTLVPGVEGTGHQLPRLTPRSCILWTGCRGLGVWTSSRSSRYLQVGTHRFWIGLVALISVKNIPLAYTLEAKQLHSYLPQHKQVCQHSHQGHLYSKYGQLAHHSYAVSLQIFTPNMFYQYICSPNNPRSLLSPHPPEDVFSIFVDELIYCHT